MPNNLYRLNSIALSNFWCYDGNPNLFEMGESVTAIIGLNGADKTAFLTAVKKAISFILSKDKHKEVRSIGIGVFLNVCQKNISVLSSWPLNSVIVSLFSTKVSLFRNLTQLRRSLY